MIKPLNESRGTYVPPSNVQPPPKPQHLDKPKTEMTTYNLLILDKAIQHHYESREVICPTQEEVENALRDIRIELQDLKEENAELMVTLNAINKVLTGTHVANEFSLIELVFKIKNIASTTLNKIKGQMI